MSKILAALHDKLHALVAEFEKLAHPAAAELRAIHTRLHTEEHQLAAAATADGKQLAADAEHAAAPVIAEAEHDAQQLAADATTAITTTPAPDQPPAAPTA